MERKAMARAGLGQTLPADPALDQFVTAQSIPSNPGGCLQSGSNYMTGKGQGGDKEGTRRLYVSGLFVGLFAGLFDCHSPHFLI